MSKIEFKKQNIPFTQVANGVLYDNKLSLGAKTVYAYMYSKPDGWEFSSLRISKELFVSKTTILNHLMELKEWGYLISQKLPSGRMLYKILFPPLDPESRIYTLDSEPESRKAMVQKSHGAESSLISNKERESNTDRESNTISEHSSQVVEIIKSFEGVNPACKKMYGNTTQRKACLSLIEVHSFEKVMRVISRTLPKTNNIEYLPSIFTPLQLYEKWSALESGIIKLKNKKEVSGVAFK